MHVSGSTYLFTVASLRQLSHDMDTPSFAPTAAQKVIFEQALRILDLELSLQAAENPDLLIAYDRWLAANR
ncbi:hypothetical protein [Fibrella aquatica]|uniref:hypothetical protein n=1 Tax=Fibrella aquatica TaxID=3242487 RepID=UPI00352023F2